jgi:hypothetical protein
MKSRFHGILSIALVLLALFGSSFVIFLSNNILGIIYFILIPILFTIIARLYCTKCQHTLDDTCRHVIIGKIAKVFKYRDERYTAIDIIGTSIAVIFLVSTPQYWLIRTPYLFLAFWVLFLIAGIDIFAFVCKDCRNKNCFNCKANGYLPYN